MMCGYLRERSGDTHLRPWMGICRIKDGQQYTSPSIVPERRARFDHHSILVVRPCCMLLQGRTHLVINMVSAIVVRLKRF